MRTEDLIDTLARQQPVAQRGSLRWTLPLAASLLASLAALALLLGQPLPALPQIGAAPYIMKLTFAVSVAIIGGLALKASGTPGRGLTVPLLILAIPFSAVVGLAGLEINALEVGLPGRTWLRCLTAIALLTPLGFAACTGSLRRLAPTRLRVSGALAGMVAASIAASAYAFWCPETTATFLLAWYALPILAAGGIGALLGPALLRW